MGDIDREMLRVRCLIGVPMISQDFFLNLHVMDFTNIVCAVLFQ